MPRLAHLLLALALVASPAFAVLRSGPEVVLTDPTFARVRAYSPLVASNGSGFLAAWSGGASAFAMPISVTGQLLRDRPIAVGVPADRDFELLDIASDGRNYVFLTRTQQTIDSTVVDADGHVLATNPVAAAVPGFVATAAVAWNGSEFLVAYSAGITSTISGQFLDRNGKPAGSPFVLLDSRRDDAESLTSNGSDFLVAMTAQAECDPDLSCRDALYTRVVRADGSVGSLNTIAGIHNAYVGHHGVAWTGSSYLLAYSDRAGALTGENVVPLNATGEPVRGATVIGVNTGFFAGNVATNGGAIVFIGTLSTTEAMRFDANGDPIDAQPFVVLTSSGAGNIASSGSTLFAVWSRVEQAISMPPVNFGYGALIDFTQPQSGVPLGESAVDEKLVDVASAGRSQLVLDLVRNPLQWATVYARQLVDGIPIGTPQTIIPQAIYADPTAAIATHDDDFLIVTAEYIGRLSARLMHAGSSAGKDIEIARGARSPAAIWTGDSYLVMWTGSDGDPFLPFDQLRAIRISANGELLDSAPRVVDTRNIGATADAQIVSTPSGLVALFDRVTLLPQACFGFMAFRDDIYAVHVSAAGDFSDDPVLVAGGAVAATLSHVAADPFGHIFVTDVEGPRDCSTQPASAHAIVLSGLSPIRRIDLPSAGPRDVAWDGSAFLVTLGTSVQRYSADGDLLEQLDVPATLITPAPGGAFVASTHSLPDVDGSDAQRLVGRLVFDVERRRVVMPR